MDGLSGRGLTQAMLRQFLLRTLLCVLVWGMAASAGACPVCDTGTGQAVRAELVDENLSISVWAVVSPFVVVLGAVGVVGIWPSARRGGV